VERCLACEADPVGTRETLQTSDRREALVLLQSLAN